MSGLKRLPGTYFMLDMFWCVEIIAVLRDLTLGYRTFSSEVVYLRRDDEIRHGFQLS